MNLAGKTVVITGASRGLGHGLASAFAAQGIKLGLCARTMNDDANAQRVTGAVDVTNSDAVNRFADRVVEHLGSIDVWINNAGLLEPIAPLREVDSAAALHHLNVNIIGVINGSRTYVNHVRESGHAGVLINISSGAGRHGYAGWSVYCAGKAAVDRLSECIKLEESETALRVHALAPGVIDTDMQSLIRGCTPEQFPAVERFREMKRNNTFSSIAFVAGKMLELAFDPAHRTDEVLLSFPLGQ